MNVTLCAQCDVCRELLPDQDADRLLVTGPDPVAKMLVIDDAENSVQIETAIEDLNRMLGGVSFAYAPSVRCSHQIEDLSLADLEAISARCAVWTGLIAENRSLILATRRGLSQLKVGAERKEGDAFRVGRLGIVLCIPPLNEYGLRTYQKRIERVMREAGIST